MDREPFSAMRHCFLCMEYRHHLVDLQCHMIGVIAAILINTFMWSLVMVWWFHLAKRRLGPQLGYFSLIFSG